MNNSRDAEVAAELAAELADYLHHHPYCSQPGCAARATHVDHFDGVSDENLRPYCHRHHDTRTQPA